MKTSLGICGCLWRIFQATLKKGRSLSFNLVNRKTTGLNDDAAKKSSGHKK
jgi:hypothetical protein